MKKIGIYGGRFSPPHNGHIAAAKAFIDALALDELIVLPSGKLPRKESGAPIENQHRLAMTRLAFGTLPQAVISDYEITKQDYAYTAETLEHFASQGKLFFLCGEDRFQSLPHWYQAETILSLATVVVAYRKEDARYTIQNTIQDIKNRYHAEILLLNNPVFPLSSTEIREAIAKKESLNHQLPASVEEYIHAHKLYR